MKTIALVLSRASVLAVVALAVIGAQGAYFYQALYQSPPFEIPNLKEVSASVPTPTASVFTVEKGEARPGRCLIDLSSENNFRLDEVSPLLLRIMSFGYTLSYLEDKKEMEKELGVTTIQEPEKKEADKKEPVAASKEPEKKLEPADAFIVIAPKKRFSMGNARTIKEFVKKGGRLLLIGDPGRPNEISWLSAQFGLIFEKGYLYNMQENEGNFRNIFITGFAENEITKGLNRIALYFAGCISPAARGIAFTDNTTSSSMGVLDEKLSPVALSEDSKVLAIADATFLTPPFDAVFDNSQLIHNIAGWLTTKP